MPTHILYQNIKDNVPGITQGDCTDIEERQAILAVVLDRDVC